MNQAGYPFTTYPWYGHFAPAKTPAAIVARLNLEINYMLSEPDFKAQMAELN